MVGEQRLAKQAVATGGASPRLTALAWLLLFGLLAWAPFPYGSNRPWSWSLLATAVGLLLVLMGVARLLGRDQTRLPVVGSVAAVTTAAVWLWAWAQTVPLDRLPVTPSWLSAQPFWAEVAAAGLAPAVVAGLNADAGRDALARLIAYGGAFWLAVLLFRDAERSRRLLRLLLVVTGTYAFYGLVNHFAGWDTVLWESEPKFNTGSVTSTFVNRNNFATYANLGLLVGLGLLIEPFLRVRGAGEARRVAAEVAEQLLTKSGPVLVGVTLLASAMLLSGSRGGFLSVIVALIAFGLLVFAATRPRVAVLVPTLVGAILGGWALLWVSGATTLGRLDREGVAENVRTEIWRQSVALIEARPYLGHGYGNYQQAFYPYRTPSLETVTIDKAHNTYLEHAAELGIPATVLLYLGPVLLFGYTVRGVFVRRKNQVVPLVAASATVLVGVHSLVDFSLQIPAVGFTYAVILGAGVAQSIPYASSSRRRRRTGPAPGASLRE